MEKAITGSFNTKAVGGVLTRQNIAIAFGEKRTVDPVDSVSTTVGPETDAQMGSEEKTKADVLIGPDPMGNRVNTAVGAGKKSRKRQKRWKRKKRKTRRKRRKSTKYRKTRRKRKKKKRRRYTKKK